MKCEIIKRENNPLLKREEMVVSVENKICPKKEELINCLNLDPTISVVKKIFSSFGSNKFEAEIFVYKTKEDKEKIEKTPRKVRKKILEEIKKQQEAKSAGGSS